MRSYEFILTERAIHHPSLPVIRTTLQNLKSELWENDLVNVEIESILNARLRRFYVKFNEVSDTAQDSEYSNVGLNGADYNPSTGFITIGYTWHLAEVLNGETREYFEDFTRLLLAVISHELKHQEQTDKSPHNARNPQDPDDIKAYLSDSRELEAYAAQAAIELEGQLSTEEVLQKLKTERGRDELSLYSEGVRWYVTHFDSSPLLNKFFSKLYSILTTPQDQTNQ